MTRLKTLDLSTNVGHGYFAGRGIVPTFGTLKLEGPDLTFKCGQLLGFLYDEYDRQPFDGLAWERPLLVPTDTVDKLELLYGLVGICYAFIGDVRSRGIHLKWCEVTVDDAKLELCGTLTKVVDGKRRKMDKDDMLYHARRTMGWRVTDHHQSDAGAVGLCAYSRLWPKRAPS